MSSSSPARPTQGSPNGAPGLSSKFPTSGPKTMPAENPHIPASENEARLRVIIRGAVQGVGFRPFVYRLATEARLRGWVSNTSQGVFIEVEGPKDTLDTFLLRLGREKPPRSSIQSLESSFLDPVGFESFEIRESEESGPKTVLVMA